jgi:hypothetical protein
MMQTEKKDGGQEATRSAQAAQALQCRTTIIAGADAPEDRTGRLVAFVKELGHRGRFDLLTVLDPGKLVADRRLFDQVARDAALAIKLHSGEQIVVAVYGDPAPLARALKERPEFRAGVAVTGLDLRSGGEPAPSASPTVAFTCMDFRHHDADLALRLRMAFDLPEAPAIVATAGGAKELTDAHPRGRRTLQRLKARAKAHKLDRIVLTCHTDCGALGGDAAPAFCDRKGRPDHGIQIEVLERHLREAAASFKAAFPRAKVETGIVRLKDGRMDRILPVRS